MDCITRIWRLRKEDKERNRQSIAIDTPGFGTIYNTTIVVISSIIKKEPKSDDRLSKFDWHDLSPIFLTIMLLHNLKVF